MVEFKTERGDVIPVPCPAGKAVITDEYGNGIQLNELHNFIELTQGSIHCRPVKESPRDTRQPMCVGSLVGQIRDKTIVMHAVAPFPTGDGKVYLEGNGSFLYPWQYRATSFEKCGDAYYNKQSQIGAEMLSQARAALEASKAKREAAAVPVGKKE